jgi:hypothetical protein
MKLATAYGSIIEEHTAMASPSNNNKKLDNLSLWDGRLNSIFLCANGEPAFDQKHLEQFARNETARWDFCHEAEAGNTGSPALGILS